jgi:Cu(I)/Ag(I) efflux system membrane fusion protein
MKISLSLLGSALLSLCAFAPGVPAFAADPAPAASARPLYRCPMHPHITSDHPGKCTICGMDLVASPTASTTSLDRTGPALVALGASQITTIGVETSPVSRQPLTRTLRVNGQIDDNDTRHRILAARVPGRVESLGINYVGAEVAAGATLATIYSPEMLSAQRVYVERIRAGEGAFPLAERSAARERLLELGLTEADLAALEKNLAPSATIVVRAPSAGTVVSKSVYEGQYVQTSDRLFEIADFSSMWFTFEAYEQDIAWLRPGQSIEITTRAVPGEVIHTKVEFIDPNFNETTRTAKVRATLPNPHYNVAGEPHRLPHRVVAEGRVLLESPAVLAAPRSAILDPGTGPVAYVDVGAGRYEQRSLRLGRRGDALVEVLSGLAENDRVVTTGALLLDAQAQLNREGAAHDHARMPAATTTAVPHLAPAMAGAEAAPAPPSEYSALAAAALDATAALANDDFASYQKLFPSLTVAARGLTLPTLEVGDNLKAARRSFEPWSTAVADLLKPQRTRLGLKIFQCPMTPVLGQGRWVQRSQPIKNPFFGSAMPDCGEEVP